MVPLGCIGAWAWAGPGTTSEPADAPTAPIVTPSRFRKSRRLTSSVIHPPSVGGSSGVGQRRLRIPLDIARAQQSQVGPRRRTLRRGGFAAMIEAETMAAAVRATVGRAFWGVTSAI